MASVRRFVGRGHRRNLTTPSLSHSHLVTLESRYTSADDTRALDYWRGGAVRDICRRAIAERHQARFDALANLRARAAKSGRPVLRGMSQSKAHTRGLSARPPGS